MLLCCSVYVYLCLQLASLVLFRQCCCSSLCLSYPTLITSTRASLLLGEVSKAKLILLPEMTSLLGKAAERLHWVTSLGDQRMKQEKKKLVEGSNGSTCLWSLRWWW